MSAISYTAANVKLPNETEVIKIRGTMGAASLVPGMPVYLDIVPVNYSGQIV